MLAASWVALLVGAGSTPVHAQSPLDGFNPGANSAVQAIAIQPDGKILVVGNFTGLGGGTGATVRNRIGRLNPDGSVDPTFNPGANGAVFTVALQQDGKVLVGGQFTMLGGGGTGTTARSHIGRLNPDGSLDTAFNPGASNSVDALAVQPDGKILVGGIFTMLGGGGSGTTARASIGRLNPDGSLDTTFNPGASNSIQSFAVQPDGKIVVGGNFTKLGGGGFGTTTRNNIGRLHSDGSLDVTFNPGANEIVYVVTLQPDGKILVGGGGFTGLGGGTGTTARSNIGRLHPDGSVDTTFDPGANNFSIHALTVQPDGKILVGGDFTTLGGGGIGTTVRNRIGRLHPDGSLDATFDPGADVVLRAVAVQPDGKILVGGNLTTLGGGGTGTTTRRGIGRLHADGTLEADFNSGAEGPVFALAVQPDDKILVGGGFSGLVGVTGTTVRSRVGRLHPDGTLDATFNPGANDPVHVLVVQPDGRILVGGDFTMLGGGGDGTTVRNYIGRLHADGTLDATFNPGANSSIWVMAVQADGKILVGGDFTTIGGGGTGTTARSSIGRLNPNGTIDTTFNPGANGTVYVMAVQPDGKILVGGQFTMLGGGGTGTTARSYIGRLHPDGSLDTTFNPGANQFVYVMAVQPDGKILVGGQFTALGGGTGTTARANLGRLNPDGSVDATFNPGANNAVENLAVQPDGKIAVAGEFTTLGGGGTGTTTRNRIGRLHANGSLDVDFNPGANASVYAMAMQPDGKILLGGPFTGLGGGTGTTARANLGRLSSADAAIQRLSVSCPGCVPTPSGVVQTQVTWARSGAGPELERVTFEVSSNGVTYAAATSATRVSGGWQAPQDLSSNVHGFIRARGYHAAGEYNGSGSIVESIRQVYIACPAIAPTSLAAGTVGVAYSMTFTAPGALGVVSFSTTSTLPTGVLLSPAGVLAGTPTQTGMFPVTVTATDGSSGCAGSRAYTLTINPATTLTMALDKTALRFGAVTNGAAFVSQTAAQIVRLIQTGIGTVTWTATPNQLWLQVSPASGTGSANLSISVVSIAGLPVESAVTGAITLTFTGASNTAGPIAVTLNLIPNGASASPFGFVDTPLDNTTGVTGAIPFTGWSLDDVEVTRVMVCRLAVGAEVAPVDPNCGGAAQIFVGFAVFIDGARTDVAALYPLYPMSTRAGWGFMVLTNMLPNQGNGTYLFYMHAQDRDGHTTLLGTRTITCANVSATKPFGAIDTPTQGGIASGSSFVNFGWALTPQPKLIPINGSTITVLVDGASLGTVDYNHERPDIEALFPDFQNTAGPNGAVGFRMIDTTRLTNGLHTISWTVTDNGGEIEGIGSRFFTVVNGTGAVAAAVELAASSRVRATAEIIGAAPRDDGPVLARRGWDLEGPWRWYGVGGAGRAVIRGEEIDRFELALGEQAGAYYTGHVRVGAEVAPLPVGSHLDATTGLFTWAPGVGFVGRYDLVFVRWEGTRAAARHEVRVILAPKGSGHVGVQVAIDVPRSRQDVLQPFLLAGWAADLDATAGTGIDTLHVWAYPATGGAPVFLGTPALGGVRPDVAAVHGDQFREAGFALAVQGLIPGDYDLAVFPWSNVTGGFAPPNVVRVTVR
jgi:uncharacterized delta-60 repeat protein